MTIIYKCVWAAYRLFVRCNFGSYTLRGFACAAALYIQGVLLDLPPNANIVLGAECVCFAMMITALEGPCPLNKNGQASQEPGRGQVAALCMVGTLVARNCGIVTKWICSVFLALVRAACRTRGMTCCASATPAAARR
jgi:hypothetical protein